MFRRSLRFCCPAIPQAVQRSVDVVMEKFAEARELLNEARESQGTSYFGDDLKDAGDMCAEVSSDWEALLTALAEEGRGEIAAALRKSSDLKIKQLHEEFDLLTHDDD